MMKYIISVLAVALVAACLVSGCSTTTPPADIGRVNTIEVDDFQINPGEDISFNGYAALPDGAVLRSQLYADDTPVAWWPADEDIQVQGESWLITVQLGENGAPPELLVGPLYLFKVWEEGSPSVTGMIGFDLVDLPAE
jgi:hypothetical protein